MSRYEIYWTPTALRHFDQLPEKFASAIIELCEGDFASEPARMSKALNAPFEGKRSVRRGQYRVIISIDEIDRKIFIHAIRHRNVAYINR